VSGAVPAGELFLTVDCSTTASKAVVFDATGAVLAGASRPLDLSQPRPGWYEQDAEQWWTATVSAIIDVAAQVDAGLIGSLCLTHQRESFVCLGPDGDPLRPAILWADGRAGAQIAAFGNARIHDLSGKPPDVTPALYKLAWLREHEPSVLRDAVRVGDVQAYLAWRLTGRWATSHPSADTLGLLDLRRLTWSPDLLEIAGLRAGQLPELVPAGQELGPLSPAAVAALGPSFPSGGRALRVIAGIGDGQAAGIGADVTAPGSAYLNLGTSMVLGVQTGSYQCDPAFRTLAGVVPGTYTLETILNSAAYLAGWFREQFGDPELTGAPDPALEAAAAALPPGAEGLLTLPYWNAAQTPYWDADARGAMVGWHGRHTRAHMYRSILEAVGFELRLHLEGLEKATGQPVVTLRAMGGGSRSLLWTQIVADITQRPVLIGQRDEVSALGAAVIARAATTATAATARPNATAEIVGPGATAGTNSTAATDATTGIAAMDATAGIAAPAATASTAATAGMAPAGSGFAERITEAAAAMAGPSRSVTPRASVAAAYDQLFAVYRQLYPRLQPVFEALAHLPT
jgi:xylulokinase